MRRPPAEGSKLVRDISTQDMRGASKKGLKEPERLAGLVRGESFDRRGAEWRQELQGCLIDFERGSLDGRFFADRPHTFTAAG